MVLVVTAVLAVADAPEALVDDVALLPLEADWLSNSANNWNGLKFRLLVLLIPDTTNAPSSGIGELLIALNHIKPEQVLVARQRNLTNR